MIFAYFTFGNFHLVLAMFFICILAESNRVPFDLPEAESELVAGFITEYSSIYFSLILLTEYANIIGMSFWMIILFSIFPLSLLMVVVLVCLIRSTLNRLKFDELMSNAWIVLLPILFYAVLVLLMLVLMPSSLTFFLFYILYSILSIFDPQKGCPSKVSLIGLLAGFL